SNITLDNNLAQQYIYVVFNPDDDVTMTDSNTNENLTSNTTTTSNTA
ncbi:4908_t:CDS:1, partial [Ambispora leptoticha]